MKGLLVVAEDSLIVEAIGLGLQKSGEFRLLGRVGGSSASGHEILESSPDVVLIDDTDDSEHVLQLIREIKAECASVAVIALTLSTDSARLDALFHAGATAAVSKATEPAALATLLRETINGHILHLHEPLGSVKTSGQPSDIADTSLLSARELEVLGLVASGSTNGEIARKLWVTEQTVKFHLSNIYRKLEVGNRTEASRYAHVHGLVTGRPAGGPPE